MTQKTSTKRNAFHDYLFARPNGPVYWNHSIINSYPGLGILDRHEGLYAYQARALCLTSPGDTIVLHPALAEDLPIVMRHYDSVGLSYATDIAWSVGHEVVETFDKRRPYEVFLFDREVHGLYPNKKRLEATEWLNNKNNFVQLCQQYNVPVPPTRFYQAGEVPNSVDLDFPVYIKGAVSASGLHIKLCHTLAEVQKAARTMPADYQVQTALPAVTSACAQYIVVDGKAHFMAAADQIVEQGVSHCGNVFPCHYDPRSATDIVASAIAGLGYEGIFGLDVLVMPDGTVSVLECNPRSNGSTYPVALATKLGLNEWSSEKVPFAGKLSQLDLKDVQYNPATRQGIIISAWGHPTKLPIFVAGNPKERAATIKKLKAVIAQVQPI